MQTFRLSVAAVLILVSGCSDSPTGPSPVQSGPITVGTGLTVSLTHGGPGLVLTFQAVADSAYYVRVTPTTGTLHVSVYDSTTTALVADAVVSPTTPDSAALTNDFLPTTSGPYSLIVSSSPTGQVADAELRVDQVPTAPEHVSAALIYDTQVSAESLDTYADIDRFSFSGVAGDIVEPLITATGPASNTELACMTVIAPDGQRLRTAAAVPGGFLWGYTQGGRVTLPATGTYRVEVASGRNECFGFPPFAYRGPYSIVMSRINPRPESLTDSVTLGDTVSGEAIDGLGDLDLFTLHGTPGNQVEILTQATGSGSHHSIRLQVPGLADLVSQPGDSLSYHPTGRLTIPDSGRLTLRFSGAGDGPAGDTGPYRFYAYRIDSAPEHHSVIIAPGDTVKGETIDQIGDIDRFTFTGVAGREFNIFFQALGVAPQGDLILQVFDSTGAFVSIPVPSTLDNGDSTNRTTGDFTLPRTGTYTIQVEGSSDTRYTDVGPYQFFLYSINPAPETHAANVTLGDSILDESIDLPGDIDEFHINVPQDTGADIDLTFSGQGGLLSVALTDSASHDTVAKFGAYSGVTTSSGTLRVPAGHYILRVADMLDAPSLTQGHYAIRTHAFSFGPENAPDTIAIGDTISTEAINVPGDVDVYTFYGVRGQHITIAAKGRSTPDSQFTMAIVAPGEVAPFAVWEPAVPESLGFRQNGRMDLPATGWYRFGVSGPTGAYTVALVPVSVAPEHVPAAVVIGDTVTGESIDTLGDWDQFTLTGTPGDSARIVFTSAQSPGAPMLVVYDSVADSAVASVGGPGLNLSTGVFRIPASGVLEIQVFEPRLPSSLFCIGLDCNAAYSYTGAYSFHVEPAPPNGAPQAVPTHRTARYRP